ncbi:hypothetical protein ASE48_19685 [Mycobacterium sp. Root265]|uniref:TNT domain-containing protein n=1 Tax=Mycobacterium sp. Root265 TaxID=1736504 RepID=UPI000710A56C|nr:TNT domain-containing protein [Mycobacterium sp. Root265]KRD04876.1 hypothetical protein ASE48_19685 [Mycobacterium sp. Root265]
MRIEVEPQALIDAGKQVGSLGAQLGALSDAMGQTLSDGIASGTDPAGLNFGISYGRQADEFGKQLAQLANAFKSVGMLLEATGFNYKNADAASTAGGPGPSGSVSGEQAETTAGDAPYAPNGSIVPPPSKWWMIQPFLNMIPLFGAAMTWPTGNASMMNLTAAQWANIGRGLKVFEPALAGAAAAAGAQNIPEVEQINKALKDLGDGATNLASFGDQMATTISDFAKGVQETQDSIRDLLDRLSLDGLWDTVTGLLSGDGDKVLREIAEDVGNVLENFQNQVQGVLGLLSELQTLLGEAADSFQKWIRPVLVGAFGDDVGNALADAVKISTDLQAGLGIAVIGLVSGTVALADPDTWKGLADTAIMIAKDPTMIDDVLLQSGSEFIAWDEITGDNPARGVGEALGNIGSLFIPGGALAKGGSVAKGLAATRRLLDGGGLEGLGRLPGLGGNRVPDAPELPDAPAAPNIPEFTPPPGIPGSVLGPNSPGGGPSSPTPTSPTSPGSGSGGGPAPTGPSTNGSGPSQSGGGAGPGSSSSNGAAPTGGSPSPSGSSGGPSSNGPVPTGGSPSSSGGDGPSKPSGGAPLSPSMSSPGDSPGSSGPSQSPSGAGPAGGGDGPGGGSSASGGGSGGPSPDDRASSPTGGSSNTDSSPHHTSGDGSLSEPDLKQSDPENEAPTGHPPNDGGGQSKDDGGNSGTSDSSGVSGAAPEAAASDGDVGGHSNPLHSDAQRGDGWHRLDNDEIDVDYGRHPLDEHWTYGDYPDVIAPEVRGLISDPDAPWGRDDDGSPLSQDQYESVYNKSGPNGDHWQNWPPNAGAVPETRLVYDRLDAFIRDFGTLDGNLEVDRIGKFEGDYLAVMSDGIPATFEQRSLPIYSLTQPYHQFEMSGDLPDGWTVEVSEVAPAFGRDGGGTQVRILDADGNAVLIPRLKGLGILQ